ncbi:MAG: VOC family protein [Acidimicrobiales bacterium]
MSGPAFRISFTSLLTRDIAELSDFYHRCFGWPEVMSLRSDLFRGLDSGNVIVGFSDLAAAEVLGVGDLVAPEGVRGFLTVEVDSDIDVEERTLSAEQAGATVRKAPYRTYYGAYQSVLLDPEGNAFRINHLEVEDVDHGAP